MKPPAFQFYSRDFLIGIMGMTDQEVGVYIRMLAVQWDRGGLPSTPREIRSQVGSTSLPTASVISKFTLGDDGLLRNDRLEGERQKQESYRASRSGNANSRWKHKHSTSNAHAFEVHKSSICIQDALQSASASAVERGAFAPPTEAEAVTAAVEMGMPKREGTAFINHHQTKGWMIGKSKMKDWRAAMRTWYGNFKKFAPPSTSAIGGVRQGRAC